MNAHDSERIKGMLESLGLGEAVTPEEADVVVFNTCTIREKPDTRLAAYLGECGCAERHRPDLVVAVGGCYAEAQREQIFERYPFVDVAFGPGSIPHLGDWIEAGGHAVPRGRFGSHDSFAAELPAHRERRFQAWVQVSMGCNSRCAYCIVPAVRGREQSRRPGEIVAEVTALARDGVREVTLLGQNVNSWGRDLAPGLRTEFGELLRACDAVDGIERIRFTSPHPKDFREPVIAAMAECASVCEHVHLPLQSGSSRLLKRMRRTYDRDRYLRLVDRLRTAIPDLALGTDLIVGFPGETEEDFEQTLEVVEAVRYDSAFTFIFSPRAGTEAAACRTRCRTRSSTSAWSGWSSSSSASPPSGTRSGWAAWRRCSSRAEQDERTAPAGPDPARHDRQLRGLRAPRRPRRRADRGLDLDDAPRPCGRPRRRLRSSRSSGRRPPASPGPPRPSAARLGTEVVSADALQVYRGLPILTNQPDHPTRLVAIRELWRRCPVGEYAGLAHAAIDELVAARGSAVVAGGTGLYLRAALVDLRVPPAPVPGARERWETVYDSDAEHAYERLAELDPAAAAVVHRNDRRRVVRALELAEAGASLVAEDDACGRGRCAGRRSSSASRFRRRCSRCGSRLAPGRCSTAASSRRRAGPSQTPSPAPPRRRSACASSPSFPTRRSSGSSPGRVATPPTSGSGCGASRASS